MKNLLLYFFFVALLVQSALAQRSIPKYPQDNFVLYQGGPSISIQSWGLEDINNVLQCNTVWSEGGKAGGPGNLVATHHLAFSNLCFDQVVTSNSAPLSSMVGVSGYWQIPSFTSSALINSTLACEFTMSEIVRIQRGRWYNDVLTSTWYTPIKCDSNILKTHSVKIVEPIAFINTSLITNLCSNQERIDLRNYVNDPSGVFTGMAMEEIYFFNPSKAAMGSNIITYNKVYDNGSLTISLAINVSRVAAVNAGIDVSVCQDYGIVNLANATPSGGTWSGPYVTANGFTTVGTPPGSYKILYSITNINNCTAKDEKLIVINAIPVVSAGPNLSVCFDAGVQTLSGSMPTGGFWSGDGVDANTNTFNPKLAGIGLHSLLYTYSDSRSLCAATATRQVQVFDAPVANAGLDLQVCNNTGNVTLSGTPANGVWVGPGVSGTTFDPVLATPGSHLLTLNTVNAQGCRSADTRIITVYQSPVIEVAGNYTVCQNAPPFILGGSPAGGVWSGTTPALRNNAFDPRKEINNNILLKYTFTDANSCSASKDITVNLLPKPLVLAPNQISGCLNNNFITLNGAQPTGGNWIGKGVSGSTFDTRVNGIGTHAVLYTVQNNLGCKDSARTNVVVFPEPTVNAGPDSSLCQSAPDVALNKLPLSPVGGTWSGPGVLNNVVKVANLPVGSSKFYYRVSDANGCSGIDSITLSINPVPPSPIITGKLQYCFGAAVQLQGAVPGDAAANIYWYHSPTGASIAQGATYNKIADTSRPIFAEALNPAFNCASIKTLVNVVVENPKATVTIDKDSADFGGRVAYLANSVAGSSYEWAFTTGLPSIEKDPIMYFYKAGYIGYTLKVTSPLGCTAQQVNPQSVYVMGRQIPVISYDPFAHPDITYAATLFSIYPNPANEHITVELLNGSVQALGGEYKIVGSLGQIILQGVLAERINVESLSPGVYQFIVQYAKEVRVYSFQKI